MVFGGEVSRVGRSVRVLAGSSVGLIQRLMIYFEYECRQSAEFQTGAYRTTEKKVLGFFPWLLFLLLGGVKKHTPLGSLSFVRALVLCLFLSIIFGILSLRIC